MKYYPSNFDQKIIEQQIPIKILYASEGNNNTIRELLNIIMHNPNLINNLGPYINMVRLSFSFII